MEKERKSLMNQLGNALTVEFPAALTFLKIGRINASMLASDAGFDVDDLDDVRLAVGEAVNWLLLDEEAGGVVRLVMSCDDSVLRVEGERIGVGVAEREPDELVLAILGATVDRSEFGSRDGGNRWFTMEKRRLVLDR